MTRKELEKRTGLKRSAIQFYMGIFAPFIDHSENNQVPGGKGWVFTDKSAQQFIAIIEYRKRGLSIRLIGQILSGAVRMELVNG